MHRLVEVMAAFPSAAPATPRQVQRGKQGSTLVLVRTGARWHMVALRNANARQGTRKRMGPMWERDFNERRQETKASSPSAVGIPKLVFFYGEHLDPRKPFPCLGNGAISTQNELRAEVRATERTAHQQCINPILLAIMPEARVNIRCCSKQASRRAHANSQTPNAKPCLESFCLTVLDSRPARPRIRGADGYPRVGSKVHELLRKARRVFSVLG